MGWGWLGDRDFARGAGLGVRLTVPRLQRALANLSWLASLFQEGLAFLFGLIVIGSIVASGVMLLN